MWPIEGQPHLLMADLPYNLFDVLLNKISLQKML